MPNHALQMNTMGVLRDSLPTKAKARSTMLQCDICGETKGKIINSKVFGCYLCGRHHAQMKQKGMIMTRTMYDPNEIVIKEDMIEIVLYNKSNIEIGRALVDIKHHKEISKHKWNIGGGEYVFTNINGKLLGLHRFIMNPPDGIVVDHINHNKLDNRECNLRICTHQQNSWNSKVNSKNTSGHKGVSWSSTNKQWQSYITVNGKPIRIGQFKDIDDAIAARKAAETKYFGDFAYNPGL